MANAVATAPAPVTGIPIQPPVAKGGKAQRDINLDIIRIVALLCVNSVHFMLHNGFYSHNVDSPSMYVMAVMRTMFMVCVPLFLLLTGYLQSGREISLKASYYLKLGKIMIPYLLIMFLDMMYYIIEKDKVYSVTEGISNYTSFTHYSWYVEMYLGLFVLIPFLNLIWLNLKSTRSEIILICTLITLTILPSVFNIYDFSSARWWTTESSSYLKLIPAWWTKLYPLTYYFIGAFLKRHKDSIRIKPVFLFLIWVGTVLLSSCYNILRVSGKAFSVFAWNEYNSFQVLCMAVALFVWLNSIKFRNPAKWLRVSLSRLSALCFGGYLASWYVDYMLYPHICEKLPTMAERLYAFPAIVLTVFVCAMIISQAANLIYELIDLIIKLICRARMSKKAQGTD